MFHISLLKKQVGDTLLTTKELPTTSEEGNIRLQPAAIVDHCWIKKGSKSIEEILIKWRHMVAEDAT